MQATCKCYIMHKLYGCYLISTYSTLQKQVGCFNHRVVTMVADKLERQWLWEVHSWYLKLIAQGNPIGSYPVHLTTTIHWQCSEHLWGVVTNVLHSCSKELVIRWEKHRCYEGFQCIVVVRWTGQLLETTNLFLQCIWLMLIAYSTPIKWNHRNDHFKQVPVF